MTDPEGCYECTLSRALWGRNLTYHVPHVLFCAWLMVLFLLVSLTWTGLGLWATLGVAAAWGAVLWAMIVKTQENPQWDEDLAEDLGQRYQRYYDAG